MRGCKDRAGLNYLRFPDLKDSKDLKDHPP
jgi:hypothetical protein